MDKDDDSVPWPVLWVIGLLAIVLVFAIVWRRRSRAAFSAPVSNHRDAIFGGGREDVFLLVCAKEDDKHAAVITVGRALCEAEDPYRVHVGVVLQVSARRERVEASGYRSPWFEGLLRSYFPSLFPGIEMDNVKVLFEPSDEGVGFSNAAYLGMRYLSGDESYACLIRAGNIPTTKWDSRSIEDAKSCPGCALTCAATPISWNEIDNSPSSEKGSPPLYSVFRNFDEIGLPQFGLNRMNMFPERCSKTPHLKFDFLFGNMDIFHRVPFDPWFHDIRARDLSLAHHARLFTQGIDAMDTRFQAVFRTPSAIKGSRNLSLMQTRGSLARLQTLLRWKPSISEGGEVRIDPEFDLGTYRELAEMFLRMGYSWLDRTILPHATTGCTWYSTDEGAVSSTLPLLATDVACRYGSWTEFLEKTDYRHDDVWVLS